MGRIMGLLCLALIGLSLASRTQILDEVVPTALNASPQAAITLSSYSPLPTSDWSTSFWVYLNRDVETLIQTLTPFISVYLRGTSLTTYFGGVQLPEITTATTIVGKWAHILIGSSTSSGYLVVTLREPGASFHQMMSPIELTSSSGIQLLIGACDGFPSVMKN